MKDFYFTDKKLDKETIRSGCGVMLAPIQVIRDSSTDALGIILSLMISCLINEGIENIIAGEWELRAKQLQTILGNMKPLLNKDETPLIVPGDFSS